MLITKVFRPIICLSLIMVILFAFADNVTVKAADSDGNPVMVSLGDSYSSGEGIEPFYDQELDNNSKAKSQRWICHRSKESWSGKLVLQDSNGKTSKMADSDNWYFVADSGAETWHIRNKYDKSWSFNVFNSGKTQVDAQLDVFDRVKSDGKTVDFVTITIGGNDAGFVNIITEAATTFTNTSYIMPSHLSDRLKNTWYDFYKEGGIRDNIRSTYFDIAKGAGDDATIIVAGYPQLLSTSTLFDTKEVDMINNAVHQFNDELMEIVNNCRDGSNGISIYFVSVEDAFKGHEAYSWDPYINEIKLTSQKEELIWNAVASSYSIHPNKKGAEAYAKCVQKKLDELTRDESENSDERNIEHQITNFNLIGTWVTSDGMTLTYYKDGTYDLEWDFGISEAGNYEIGEVKDSSLEIDMEGSSILSMMQLAYGGVNSNYHFEILVKGENEMALVQVYGDYTASTSPCKLPFTRQ